MCSSLKKTYFLKHHRKKIAYILTVITFLEKSPFCDNPDIGQNQNTLYNEIVFV